MKCCECMATISVALLVLDFVILLKQYFAGFYFHDLKKQISVKKRALHFVIQGSSSILNLILVFKKCDLCSFT